MTATPQRVDGQATINRAVPQALLYNDSPEMEERHAHAVRRRQEPYLPDEGSQICQRMCSHMVDAFGCCVEGDTVEEMGVQMLQFRKVGMCKAQSFASVEPFFLFR